MKEKFCQMLRNTERKGIEDLIAFMEEQGFFESPCSTKYHLCKPGGLVEHSMNVCSRMMDLTMALCDTEESHNLIDSVIICALLHDLGKAGDHNKPNYVENILKSGKQSDAEPYKTNKDLNYEEHEIRSVIIAERFIVLSEDEETAILHHNGLYGKLDSSFGSYYDKHKLAFLLHTADMWVSRFEEEYH